MTKSTRRPILSERFNINHTECEVRTDGVEIALVVVCARPVHACNKLIASKLRATLTSEDDVKVLMVTFHCSHFRRLYEFIKSIN